MIIIFITIIIIVVIITVMIFVVMVIINTITIAIMPLIREKKGNKDQKANPHHRDRGMITADRSPVRKFVRIDFVKKEI